METRQKIVSLTEEVMRRLLIQNRRHSLEERLEEMEKFSQKMTHLAYTSGLRQDIFRYGITRYFRPVLKEITGERKLYRSAEDMKESRALKPLKKGAWFRSKRGGSKLSVSQDTNKTL